MKRIIPLLILFWSAVPGWAEHKETHCHGDEEIYFNCLVKGTKKIASVCGAGYSEERNKPGYIQYRFGAAGNEEFIYPAGTSKEDLQDKFMFSGTRSSEYDHYDFDLQFENQGYAYSVLHSEGRIGDSVKYSDSVTVWRLAKECSENCLKRAPHTAPEKKQLKVLSCTNSDAGQNLSQMGRIIRLITTPGKSSATKFR